MKVVEASIGGKLQLIPLSNIDQDEIILEPNTDIGIVRGGLPVGTIIKTVEVEEESRHK